MAKKENPPFGRGETFYGPDRTIDSNNLGGVTLEGMEWEFEDLDYSVSGAKPTRTGRLVKCRLVRNVSGIPFLPKRATTWQKTAGNYGKRVDGYSCLTADSVAGIVDEWLPSAGVRNNDLFWLVCEGPTEVLNDLAAVNGAAFTIGDLVVSLTAASSQATTAGRVAAFRAGAASTSPLGQLTATDVQTTDGTLASVLANMLGRALSAKTSGQTNTGVLINLRPLW